MMKGNQRLDTYMQIKRLWRQILGTEPEMYPMRGYLYWVKDQGHTMEEVAKDMRCKVNPDSEECKDYVSTVGDGKTR